MDFWNATVLGPTDRGEDSGDGFIHRASMELVLRHTEGDLGEKLRARLAANSPVAAIVGSRIYWELRPQTAAGATLPAIVLTQISRVWPDHMDGEEDMITSTVQADCYAAKHVQAWELADAVRAAVKDEATV